MMNRIRIVPFVLAAVACVFILLIPDTLARRGMPYEAIDLLVNVRAEVDQHYVEEPDGEELTEAAVRGMLDALDDPYTIYLNSEQLTRFDKSTLGTFSGIGAEIEVQNNQLMIVSPLEDSPAFKSGILAGDHIMKVDDVATDGMDVYEAIEHITGEEGTDVVLSIRHPDGEELDITITRQRINIQTVKALWRDQDHHWDHMLDAERRIGYVRLTQFNTTSTEALREALDALVADDMQGLILDLRFNPGGLLDSAVSISSMFMDGGRIVSTKGLHSAELVKEAESEDTLPPFPLIVMVNEYSASASEIVSGALKDNDRAVILGTRTHGKGSVQQVIKLDHSPGAVKITTAHYFLPSGRNIHRKEDAEVWGVDPTDGYYVSMTNAQMRKMNEIRRDRGIIHVDNGGNGSGPETISAEWLDEELNDLQLAAAYRAMVARIDEGEFAAVGGSNATELTRVLEVEKLTTQRDQLMEAVQKIEERIGKLAAGEAPDAEPLDDASAEADTEAAADPDDVAPDSAELDDAESEGAIESAPPQAEPVAP